MAAPQKIGRYTIIRELGRGGMATVYLALDPQTNRHVALKILPRQFLHDPTFRGRFEREARTVIKIRHPAIVPVYDFGEYGEQPFLVMHYMTGGTLGERITRGPLPLPETARIVARIAGALEAAHAMGIVHRDLKPGNILFDETGEAYLADFGIVKVAEATHSFTGSAVIGTPAYMSPEQVHGEKTLDSRSDTYTLGVILFEMLTGRAPFKADTPAKMMMAHVLNPVPRILEVDPTLPAGAETVIGKAMAKDPAARYQRVAGMAADLGALAGGRTLVDVPPQANPTPDHRRNPLLAAGLGVLATLLIVGVGGALALGALRSPAAVEATATPALPATPSPVILEEIPAGNPATAAIILTRQERLEEGAASPAPQDPDLIPTLGAVATATVTPRPATRTPLPTATGTARPAASSTPLPPATATPRPPTSTPPPPTSTPVPPTSTPVPPTATNTPIPPPTATNTPLPPTATNTPVPPPTATNTRVPTPTNTPAGEIP